MIIGLTGSYCSGKDTAGEYIVGKYKFTHISLSDIIREEMKAKGVEITRENLIVFGKNLRQENGNGILSKIALSNMKEGADYCITSIRHPDEVSELKKRKDFALIYIDAPKEIRFDRMIKRNREGDPKDFKTFTKLEEAESQKEGSGQQLVKTALLADIKIINASNSLEPLYSKIDNCINNLKRK